MENHQWDAFSKTMSCLCDRWKIHLGNCCGCIHLFAQCTVMSVRRRYSSIVLMYSGLNKSSDIYMMWQDRRIRNHSCALWPAFLPVSLLSLSFTATCRGLSSPQHRDQFFTAINHSHQPVKHIRAHYATEIKSAPFLLFFFPHLALLKRVSPQHSTAQDPTLCLWA